MSEPLDWIEPDWPAPRGVSARVSTRRGGSSIGPFASLNLGAHVGDDPAAVAENRARVRAALPAHPVWLRQVHGVNVVDAAHVEAAATADAAFTRAPSVVCAIQVADCLPVLFCDRDGTTVAAAHAGWRGLSAGILERTVAAFGRPPEMLLAWLGPAIGPTAFEVGPDVFETYTETDPEAAAAFRPLREGKWLADLYALARRRLALSGLKSVYGGGLCTVSDPARFFSYRRDRMTGRQAAFIWLDI
jgi:YfiH family protein